jgi:hypothetical protein
VAAIKPRPGTQAVYNLEVDIEHVFCVSTFGVLVHNSSPGSGEPTPPGTPQEPIQPLIPGYAGQTLPPGYQYVNQSKTYIYATKEGQLFQFQKAASEPGVGQIVIDSSGKPLIIPPYETIPIPVPREPGGTQFVPPDFPDIPPGGGQ